jgi:hypothetical protein
MSQCREAGDFRNWPRATDIAPQPNVRFRKYSVSRRRPVYSPNTRIVCSIRISSAVPLAALRLNCIRTRRGPRVRQAVDATGSECLPKAVRIMIATATVPATTAGGLGELVSRTDPSTRNDLGTSVNLGLS